MIELIFALAIIGILLYLLNVIPMDPAIMKIIRVVVIVAVVFWLLEGFGIFGGWRSGLPHYHHRL